MNKRFIITIETNDENCEEIMCNIGNYILQSLTVNYMNITERENNEK